MKEFLAGVYNAILDFLMMDMALPRTTSTIIAVAAFIILIIVALRLSIKIIKWIGNAVMGI